jgi:hypothetical protein
MFWKYAFLCSICSHSKPALFADLLHEVLTKHGKNKCFSLKENSKIKNLNSCTHSAVQLMQRSSLTIIVSCVICLMFPCPLFCENLPPIKQMEPER